METAIMDKPEVEETREAEAGGWEGAVKPCRPASLGVSCLLLSFWPRSHSASLPPVLVPPEDSSNRGYHRHLH